MSHVHRVHTSRIAHHVLLAILVLQSYHIVSFLLVFHYLCYGQQPGESLLMDNSLVDLYLLTLWIVSCIFVFVFIHTIPIQ
ncbi:MAG: hypothetical protein NXY57DRAFT_1028941 [Lentinula lateritia]|uniref:Uncharacterized protein n=1 Tax=Lentinula lateritia TaxID=40482 RepID=A0ABQ8VGH5_9AGAR|nr:MAG: hypothetical protein NXY57DRAFT_1028941 [Lentinula lateritia]KAJ4493353.1 hypothetical protein C8R41DRAFT_328729 [Lentinula lateritia]